MKALLLFLVAVFCLSSAYGSLREDLLKSAAAVQEPTNYWAVEVTSGEAKARELAEKYNLKYLGQIGNLENHFHFQRLQPDGETSRRPGIHPALPEDSQQFTDLLMQEEDVGFVEQQFSRAMSKKVYHTPTDPKWTQQWSLLNTNQRHGGAGKDINVVPAWREGITGSGVVVTVVDEGVEISHPDLSGNYDSRASYDYVWYDSNPTPEPAGFGEDPFDHGTSCAGVVAMTKDNGHCGVGVAYDCNIGGVKMNLSSATDAIKASALGYQNSYIDVYSNSWGPVDFGFFVSKPGPLLTRTLRNGVTDGRGGKGSIYVFAAGNGGRYGDSCAADGFQSSIYTIGIGSADQHGNQADYDEECPGKMAVNFAYYSNGFPTSTDTFDPYGQVIATSDSGGCTDGFTGTSASAPLMSGVIALALQANPSLTWRDVQYLVAFTSNSTSLSNGNWVTNGRGLRVSHKFGFGAINAAAMVTRARTWTNVPSQLTQTLYGSSSYGSARHYSSFSTTFTVSSSSQITYLEHVVVTMTLTVRGYSREYSIDDLIDALPYLDDEEAILAWMEQPHTRRGDIKVDLTSPSGTVSHLLPYRRYDFINNEGYDSWPFMSVHHWGENPVGRWTLNVNFKSSSGYVSVSGISMKLHGVSVTNPGGTLTTAPPVTTHTTSTPPTTHRHTTSTPPTTHRHTTSTTNSHTTSTPPTTHSHTTSTPPTTHGHTTSTPPTTHGHTTSTPPTTHGHTTSTPPTTHGHTTSSPPTTHGHTTSTPPTTHGHTTSSPPTTHSHTTSTLPTAHSHTSSTPHNHTTSTPPTPHSPQSPDEQGAPNSQSNTVKYVLAGVFSVGGLLLLVTIAAVVGVVIYLRRRKLQVRFRRLKTVVDDSSNPNSISM